MEGKRIRKRAAQKDPSRTLRPTRSSGADESLPMNEEFEREGMGVAAKE